MASEVTLQLRLQVSKNNTTADSGQIIQIASQTGNEFTNLIQEVATTVEAISTVDVAAAGYLLLKNVGATNTISIWLDSAGTADRVATLDPGYCTLLANPPLPIYAKAITAASNLLVLAYEA